MIRTLIVDDEPLARKRLTALLAPYEDVDIVDECGDGSQAMDAIQQHQPDLVFLDIQMPEMTGVEVAQACAEIVPAIIFVTAHDEHAVKAFELNALDYLLKPFDADRLNQTLERARTKLAQHESGSSESSASAIRVLEEIRQQPAQRLAIKDGDRVYFVKIEDIDWIEAAGKMVRIHTGQEHHLLREPLQQLETRLDPQQFVRIHRSTIVAFDAVQSIEPVFHGEYRVFLKDGTELTLSRSYRAKLRERFGNSI